MIEWIETHYKLITGIAVPIIIAIIGLFKIRKMLKIHTKGNNNTQINAEKDVVNTESFKTTNQTNQSGIQISGNNNQIASLDINGVKLMAAAYNMTIFPHTERAFNSIGINSHDFLTILNAQFEKLSQEELGKFSHPDVQMALISAIQGAGRTNSADVHQLLGRLITDRVQKPKHAIAELVINESISVAAKLDSNLIKILALSFLLSRTKHMNLPNENVLIDKLSYISKNFDNMDVTISKFEYLESISCGKVLQFTSNNLINYLIASYPHLFIKPILSDQLNTLSLPPNIIPLLFTTTDQQTFIINTNIAVFLYEPFPIIVKDHPFQFMNDEKIKDNLKGILNRHRLSPEDVKKQILQSCPDFERIINLWDMNNFSQFSLTAVGIAIGRAYLELYNFGNYDINTWIN